MVSVQHGGFRGIWTPWGTDNLRTGGESRLGPLGRPGVVYSYLMVRSYLMVQYELWSKFTNWLRQIGGVGSLRMWSRPAPASGHPSEADDRSRQANNSNMALPCRTTPLCRTRRHDTDCVHASPVREVFRVDSS